MKGRLEFQDDLEDAFIGKRNRVIQTCQIKRGNKRKFEKNIFGDDKSIINYEVIGEYKCLFVREDKKDIIPLAQIKRFLTDLLKPRKYTVLN